MADRQRIRREVLEFLRNHGTRTFRPKELAKRLNYLENRDYRLFREILAELQSTGAVGSAKGGQVSYRPRVPELTGVLSVHPDGFGFVSVEGEADDYFVRARRMGTAIDGDTVVIEAAAPAKGDRRRSADVLRVVEGARISAVCTLHITGTYAMVLPDDLRLTHDIYVAPESLGDASDGDKVVVSIDSFEDRRGALHGRLLDILGPSTDARVQTLAVAMSHGIHNEFPADVEAEAAAKSMPADDVGERLDLRQKEIFTIDPADARDFDDALHVHERDDGRTELGIHIADVSHFVPEGSLIDREAYKRGTSVYLVDRAIPMLPENLSSNLCSLVPLEDRFTFSVLVILSPEGDVESCTFHKSIIHSSCRLTYEEAQSIIDDAHSNHVLKRALDRLNSIANRFTAKRKASGSIDFGMNEIKVILDDEGHPTDIQIKHRLDSHRLVEECMLLGNRLVAKHLSDSELEASVSRIHDHPDRDKIKNLSKYVRAFGFELPHIEGLVRPKDLNNLLESVKGKPVAPVIEQAALRSMAKARYGIETSGHYGLSMSHYTHFTSPIRRYPDLIVHRLLQATLTGNKGITADKLKKMCEHSSERERVAVEAERASIALKQVVYASDHIGDVFDGIVTSVSKFGVYVELTALLVEGMVHVREMLDDYYEYNERAFSLIGAQSGRRYRPGDAVRVILAAARVESREIDLTFLPDPKRKSSRTPSRKNRRKR